MLKKVLSAIVATGFVAAFALPVHVTFSEHCIRFGRSFDIGHIAVVGEHECGAAPATRTRAA